MRRPTYVLLLRTSGRASMLADLLSARIMMDAVLASSVDYSLDDGRGGDNSSPESPFFGPF